MIKTVKQALKYIDNCSFDEKCEIFSHIYGDKEFERFKKTDQLKEVNSYVIAKAYLKYQAKKKYQGTTINGVSLAVIEQEEDKLSPIRVWMPSGYFGPSRMGSYCLLGGEVTCTKLTKNILTKIHERLALESWEKVKNIIHSKPIGDSNHFIAPWLDYDPLLTSDQDVYFIQDTDKDIVKIGISSDVPKRLEQIRGEYQTGKLSLLALIPFGGDKVESALHKKFHKIRVNDKGKGIEWFENTCELNDFIREMNTYAFKSDYLTKKNII